MLTGGLVSVSPWQVNPKNLKGEGVFCVVEEQEKLMGIPFCWALAARLLATTRPA